MEIRELTGKSERRAAVPIVKQLWTDRTEEEIVEWTGAEDYTLFGGFVDDDLVGVAGVLVRGVLHHERHAWLYDLVVDEPRRGQGYGSELVAAVERWAQRNDCEAVALTSPLAKEGVHEYYEGQGYERWGYVIEKSL